MPTEYRQLEPYGAGTGWAGDKKSDSTTDKEFSRGAGEPPTYHTNEESNKGTVHTNTESNKGTTFTAYTND